MSKRKKVIVTLVACGLVAFLAHHFIRSPKETPVMRGYRVAVKNGCFACHGDAGKQGIRNFGSNDGEVPAWNGGSHMMYIENESEIYEWILYGHPKRIKHDHSGKELIHMPAYKDVLTHQEVDDLVAYFKSVAWYNPDITKEAKEGRKIARKAGCFGCHGDEGRGGIKNPNSFKGYIPPWDGDDFDELVENDDELREWILEGTIKRFEENPIAKHFTDNQIIQMPAYKDHLKKEEINKIISYIKFLRKEHADKKEKGHTHHNESHDHSDGHDHEH